MPAWENRARCRGADKDLWTSDTPGAPGNAERALAKAECARCPVRADCLEFALAQPWGADQGTGIWGGCTWQERKAMLRARRESAA